MVRKTANNFSLAGLHIRKIVDRASREGREYSRHSAADMLLHCAANAALERAHNQWMSESWRGHAPCSVYELLVAVSRDQGQGGVITEHLRTPRVGHVTNHVAGNTVEALDT